MTIKHLFFIIIAIVVIIILLSQSGIQRYFIYFPNKNIPDPQKFSAQDMQMVTLHTQDGLVLHAWYHPPSEKKPIILYLPGNAGHRGYRMSHVRPFIAAGFGILLLDYRGYGGNPGHPSEQGLYQDARAGMAFLRKIPQTHPIILYGESLGSGVATQMATEFPICALILQSPFTAFAALKRHFYPWLPIRLQDKYDSLQKISTIHVPILILHGQLDKIVPYIQGKTLFEQAHQPKEFLSFPEKGHNDLWGKDFSQKILAFMDRQAC